MTIIFEGALELITEKKVPLFFRVIAAAGLLAFYIGLESVLLYIGIKNKNAFVIGAAIFLLVIIAVVAVKKYKEIRCRFK